jgi:hypothetical protein
MTLLTRFLNTLARLNALIGFMFRLSLKEKMFVSFFVVSLLFTSSINVVFSPLMQKLVMEQMRELQYAFTTWGEVAVNMGISMASIFIVLIVALCFLPVVKHALQKEYLRIFLCKPVSLYMYLAAMLIAFMAAMGVLVFFWWLFVAMTVKIHTGEFPFDSFQAFGSLFAFSCLIMALFMLFYSLWRGPMASFLTILFSGSVVVLMDQNFSPVFEKAGGVIQVSYRLFKEVFSPFSDWLALAYNPQAQIETGPLLLQTLGLIAAFSVLAAIRFKRTLEKVELS